MKILHFSEAKRPQAVRVRKTVEDCPSIADSRRSLGLGLSLCKSILSAHGGTIAVSDNVPSGAVFTLTIPSGEVEVHE